MCILDIKFPYLISYVKTNFHLVDIPTAFYWTPLPMTHDTTEAIVQD